MNPNRRRGEAMIRLDGRDYRLRLTLGALAELETAFAVDDLGALARRFSSGSFSAADLTRILGAGLRGGGNAIADDEVAAMACDGGIAGCAAAVADLLNATFGGGEGQPPQNP